jgi:hypothetical protein
MPYSSTSEKFTVSADCGLVSIEQEDFDGKHCVVLFELVDEAGHELAVIDWPTSLIQMLLGGFLTGTAKSTAEILRDGLAPDVLARLERGAAANFAAANRSAVEKSAQGAPRARGRAA